MALSYVELVDKRLAQYNQRNAWGLVEAEIDRQLYNKYDGMHTVQVDLHSMQVFHGDQDVPGFLIDMLFAKIVMVYGEKGWDVTGVNWIFTFQPKQRH